MADEIKNETSHHIERKIGSFRNYSKKMNKVYSGERRLGNKMEHTTISRRYFNINTKNDLEKLLERAYTNSVDAADVSSTLASLDANYSKIISYFANMFYTRYTVLPILLDKTKDVQSEEYMEKYNNMIESVDGMNLESLVPEILKELFIKGSVYFYGQKTTSSNTVSVLILPNEYCRTIYKTNQGTKAIEFDTSYFDQFMKEDREKVFGIFPKEFKKIFDENMADRATNRWMPLEPRYASSLYVNDAEMPPFLKALEGILEYEGFRANELKRSDNKLKSILIHRIPIYEDMPIFEVEEVASIQEAINKITKRHDGLETITTFGESELIRLQEESSVENKQIGQSYNTLFNSAGLNSTIFTGESDKALDINQSADQAFVWKYLTEINTYMNVLVNNLYKSKFKPFQAEIRLLPITIAKEADQVKTYRENASFGLGRMEAVVSTGIKQKHLSDRGKLEHELDLDSLLKPLASSHTQNAANEGDHDDDSGRNNDIDGQADDDSGTGDNKDRGEDNAN